MYGVHDLTIVCLLVVLICSRREYTVHYYLRIRVIYN